MMQTFDSPLLSLVTEENLDKDKKQEEREREGESGRDRAPVRCKFSPVFIKFLNPIYSCPSRSLSFVSSKRSAGRQAVGLCSC